MGLLYSVLGAVIGGAQGQNGGACDLAGLLGTFNIGK